MPPQDPKDDSTRRAAKLDGRSASARKPSAKGRVSRAPKTFAPSPSILEREAAPAPLSTAIADAIRGLERGDFRVRVDRAVVGAEVADALEALTERLDGLSREIARVARFASEHGELGARVEAPRAEGGFADVAAAVDLLSSTLAREVREISRVTSAVAAGDLSRSVTIEGRGEIRALHATIDGMIETLGTFADQVGSVAREVGVEGRLGGQAKVPGARGTWREVTENVNQLAANLTNQVRAIADVAIAVTKGDLTRSIAVDARGEVVALRDAINGMIENLRDTTQKNREQDWLKSNLARFGGLMQGQKSVDAVGRMIMSELTPLVGAHHGAFFTRESDAGEPVLRLGSSYAFREQPGAKTRFRFGEGLVGQCAIERKPILVAKAPPDYARISSGLGEAAPLQILVQPVLFEGVFTAVVEVASFEPFQAIHRVLLDQLMDGLGVVLNMIRANTRTEQLLVQSQGLTRELAEKARELQLRQEELERTNAHLEAQAEELEEKARLLAEQKSRIEEKNREVELARASLEEKAEQLALISKYKSEFLANMSHELRTPLNSLLILAKLLEDNKEGNLTPKQVEYASTIHGAGGDLLALINEILDLSKVEAGKMQIDARDVTLEEVRSALERQFTAFAVQKGIDFRVEVLPGAPDAIRTDPQRLQQILKNLLANAFKFTERGFVRLSIAVPPRALAFDGEVLSSAGGVVSFAVEDTGIGIPSDKQRLVFEAFQQADGSTARRYGGTGLGLSISREIARLLGGEIHLESTPGRGSVFTLYLPEVYRAPHDEPPPSELPELRASEAPPPISRPVLDDREDLQPGDRVLLIVEDDEAFARVLLDVAREKGFKGVVATRGDDGLCLADELLPDAITLDVRLPVLDGGRVLERLKRNPRTRHIPVQVVSVTERRRRGADAHVFSWLEKPVTREAVEDALVAISAFVDRERRTLLVAAAHDTARSAVELVSRDPIVDVVVVADADAALEVLAPDGERGVVDAVVVDHALPDAGAKRLIEALRGREDLAPIPIVAGISGALERREVAWLRRSVDAIVPWEEHARFADEIACLLHRPPLAGARSTSSGPWSSARDGELEGRVVLAVDDDARNLFALSSVLESHGVRVLRAEDGRAALDLLDLHPEGALVLMDVMMPEMDGYETMRAVRADPRFRALPIVAITAKALKEDRDLCIEAGASDYLPKPVDPERLVQVVRLWIQA